MAGSFLEINGTTAGIAARINRLQRRLIDMKPAFSDIGEYGLNSTRSRFDTQTDPQGRPWRPLNPRYRKYKHPNADKILTRYGRLRGLLSMVADAHSVRIGTPLIYGATGQFGDPRRNIPARPFLGLSQSDEAEIAEILNDWIFGAFD